MEILSTSTLQTKKIGQLLAEELRGGEIICLTGDLGAGKTTFTQGLLKGLGAKGPYTSPTFAIIKEYEGHVTCSMEHIARNEKQKTKQQMLHTPCSIFHIFHIDAYRIGSKDLLELGFADFAGQKKSIIILEWPEKVRKIIPSNAVWINFQWLSEKERKISFETK